MEPNQNGAHIAKDRRNILFENNICRILIIDDDNNILKLFKDILELKLRECEIRTLQSGIECIENIKEFQPDVILLDIVMSDINGFEICKIIKSNDSSKHIPIIMISGISTDSSSRIKCLEVGADAFMTKPVDSCELASQVRVALRIKKAEDALRQERIDLEKLVQERTLALYESESKFRNIFENANDAILILDGNVFVDCNERALEIYGITKDQLIGKTPLELSPEVQPSGEDSLLGAQYRINEAYRGNPQFFQWQHIRYDNATQFIAEVSLNKFSTNNHCFILAIVRDVTENYKLQEKIKEHMIFIETLFNTIPGPVFYKDLNKRYIGCNKAFEKLFGVTEEWLRGKTVYDLSPQDIADEYDQSDQQILETLEPHIYDGYAKHSDGSSRDIIVNKAPFFDSNCNVAGLVGVVTDITEKKAVLKALAASEAKYRAIVEDQIELICRFSPDGKLTFVNNAYCNYFNKNQDDLIGKPFIELIDPKDRELVEKSFKSITKEKPYNHYDHRVILSTGEIRWQHWSDRAIFCENGDIKEYQSIGFDITDLKLLEQDLRRSKNKYRAILDTLQDGFYQTDKDGKICFVSQSALELLGYADRSEVIGKPVTDCFFNPDDRKHFLDRLMRSGGKIYDQELLLVNKNDEIVVTSLNVQVRFDDFGNFCGSQGVVRDVTESKRHLNEITKLYKVVEGSQNGLVVIELDGTITYANQAVLKIAKSPTTVSVEEHALGRKIKSFLSFDLPLTISDVCKIVENEGKWFGPAYLFCACSNHDRVPIDVMFSKIQDDDEKSYIVASFTETSEIIALTRKVQEQSRMYEELKDNMEILVGRMNTLKETKIKDINKLEKEFSDSVKEIKSLDSGGVNIDDATE